MIASKRQPLSATSRAPAGRGPCRRPRGGDGRLRVRRRRVLPLSSPATEMIRRSRCRRGGEDHHRGGAVAAQRPRVRDRCPWDRGPAGVLRGAERIRRHRRLDHRARGARHPVRPPAPQAGLQRRRRRDSARVAVGRHRRRPRRSSTTSPPTRCSPSPPASRAGWPSSPTSCSSGRRTASTCRTACNGRSTSREPSRARRSRSCTRTTSTARTRSAATSELSRGSSSTPSASSPMPAPTRTSPPSSVSSPTPALSTCGSPARRPRPARSSPRLPSSGSTRSGS